MAQSSTERNLLNLPDSAIIRLPDVLRLFPVSKSRWYDGIKNGEYPNSISLGARARGWRISDVLALTKASDEE